MNWRTATSYDATKALIEAIKQASENPTRQGISENPTRQGIAEKLRSLKVIGVTGEISFSNTGERQNPVIQLVEVKPGSRSNTGYDFERVKKQK